jgi:ribosomal-protein-alanine N-acetyltransferase
MNARAQAEPVRFSHMREDDVPAVLRIEQAAYPFPWTGGNFLDSIRSGYLCRVARDDARGIVGYFLMMMALDEAHLLNITVDPALHGRGYGLALHEHATECARSKAMRSIMLEVRPSNHRALAIYERYGYTRIGVRRNYYPAPDNNRENAIVMKVML